MSAYKDQNEGVTKFVYRCYSLCLGREADEGGLEGWCKAIITGSNTAKQAAYGLCIRMNSKIEIFRMKNM